MKRKRTMFRALNYHIMFWYVYSVQNVAHSIHYVGFVFHWPGSAGQIESIQRMQRIHFCNNICWLNLFVVFGAERRDGWCMRVCLRVCKWPARRRRRRRRQRRRWFVGQCVYPKLTACKIRTLTNCRREPRPQAVS